MRSASLKTIILAIALVALHNGGQAADADPPPAEGQAAAAQLLPADRPILEVIDQYIGQWQQEHQVAPAPLVDAPLLVRRTTLDLAGRIPTLAEAREFTASGDPHKRTLLVDRLLESPDFPYHHRNELDTLLQEGMGSDNAWRNWLLDAARENRPWDVMFREMLVGQEEKPNENPAFAFIRTRARDIDLLTNDTSSLFFGVNVSCAKCHDHPLVDDWRQDHYFGMAAFFDRTYLTRKNTLAEKYTGSVKFKTTAGEEKMAAFMFLTGAVVEEPKVERSQEEIKALEAELQQQMKDDKSPPPKPPEFSPRAKLVELALSPGDNRFFARNVVNRVWARLLGRGIVHPLDQMHSGNPASHPQLLDWLERDLVAHNYDLKRLVRGIVLSDTYARSSRWPSVGDPPSPESFAVAVPRPLSPRQYALSLNIATANPESFQVLSNPEEWTKQRENLENAANGFAGNFEVPGEHFQVSVDEALLMSNNPQIQGNFLRDSSDRLLGFLKGIADRPQQIETAYWAILSRAPDAEEAQLFRQFLDEPGNSSAGDAQLKPSETPAGLQQALWAIVTSPELRFNY